MEPSTAAVYASDLTKRFGSLTAVSEISLEVRPGEILGFLGPNGAGKSTTIRMLAGLLQPTSGTAYVSGIDVTHDPIAVKRIMGYLAEEPFLYPKLTGNEFLGFMADLHGVDRPDARRRAEQLTTLFELSEKRGELIEGYSHGMRQKISLIAALLHEPKVLFLDEPTNGLDPRSARAVKDLLRGLAERQRAVFLSTHVLEIAEGMCHRVAIIDGGKIIAVGSMEELRARGSSEGASLEDIFLQLTGGPESSELAAFLGDS